MTTDARRGQHNSSTDRMNCDQGHPSQGWRAGSSRSAALDGFRVFDMATVVAGPGAARYLADFGADVIKVEHPVGDSTRTMGWMLEADPDSLFWMFVNRGKRSVTLDLRSPRDHDRMLSLATESDIFIENMRPGKLEQLDLGPDVLLAANPRLVILRVSGFGQSGPYSQKPGFATIAEALSGLADLTGEPNGGPLLPPIALTDEIAALAGALGAMIALRHAERTGEGQVVDVNLWESLLQVMGPLPSAQAHLDYRQPRLGSGLPYTVPRGTYRCADGVWVALSASAESVARRVLEVLGLSHDDRFISFAGRCLHREELEGLTKSWIAERDSSTVITAFEALDAAIAPVYDMADVLADEHLRARGTFVEIDGILMQGVVAQMSRTPGKIRNVGPRLGAHNDDFFGTDAAIG